MSGEETYLGDAVYIRVREYGDIELYTSDGYEKTNIIVLDDMVLSSLRRWLEEAER